MLEQEAQGHKDILSAWNKAHLPYFPKIDDLKSRLQMILAVHIEQMPDLDPALSNENYEYEQARRNCTRQRVQRMINALELRTEMDPIHHAWYEARKNMPHILEVPTRLALFGGLSLLAVLASTPVLKKIFKGEKLSFTDAFAGVYILGALAAGGINITGKKDKEAIAAATMFGDPNIEAASEKLQKPHEVVEEFADLLKNKEFRNGFEQRLKQGGSLQGYLHDELQSDPQSALIALSAQPFTEKDARALLGKCYDLLTKEALSTDTIVAQLSNSLEMMKIRQASSQTP
jgi:hypothetical protein